MADDMGTAPVDNSPGPVETPVTPATIDDLVAQAKNLNELVSKLTAATEALKATPEDEKEDLFTQEEVDSVIAKLDELKSSIMALKTE